jgi:hypothetical protein
MELGGLEEEGGEFLNTNPTSLEDDIPDDEMGDTMDRC